MLLMSGAVVGSLGVLGSALVVLVVALVAVRQKNAAPRVAPAYDVERAIADVTLKVRHPWKYRLTQVQRRLLG